jgi:hypothetical protein
MRHAAALGICLLATACGPATETPAISPADEAKATSLLAEYEAARTNGSWEAAEAKAEKLREKYGDSAAAQALAATEHDTSEHADAVRETQRLRDAWDYQAIPAERGVQRSAAIYSRTVPVEEDQPAPIPDARLVLRDHPSWGRSAYLLLEQSTFDCGKPCALQIAFDDSPATPWAGKQADSGKGPALFINDDKKFVAALSTAKKVRIALPKGSGTIPSLVFEVGGYDAARYAKP